MGHETRGPTPGTHLMATPVLGSATATQVQSESLPCRQGTDLRLRGCGDSERCSAAPSGRHSRRVAVMQGGCRVPGVGADKEVNRAGVAPPDSTHPTVRMLAITPALDINLEPTCQQRSRPFSPQPAAPSAHPPDRLSIQTLAPCCPCCPLILSHLNDRRLHCFTNPSTHTCTWATPALSDMLHSLKGGVGGGHRRLALSSWTSPLMTHPDTPFELSQT